MDSYSGRIVAAGGGGNGSIPAEGVQKPEKGVTQQTMANFMYSLNCKEAFNLDGGGSSAMYYGYYGTEKYYNVLMGGDRDMSDIIYFATAVPPEEWEN